MVCRKIPCSLIVHCSAKHKSSALDLNVPYMVLTYSRIDNADAADDDSDDDDALDLNA